MADNEMQTDQDSWRPFVVAGQPAAFLWEPRALLGGMGVAALWCMTAMIWYAPFVGYLMLASAWAPSNNSAANAVTTPARTAASAWPSWHRPLTLPCRRAARASSR